MIEITSPGGLPPGVSFSNILWQQSPRNRRLAETFAKCGLVERSGQGMNRIFESCIRESKGFPDFNHSDAENFWITLHGQIQHEEFIRLLERIGSERLDSFTADDLLVIEAIYANRNIDDKLLENVNNLVEAGILEKTSKSKGFKFILARKFYESIGKQGVYTRKKGLDRDTQKALLLKHIVDNDSRGTPLEELRQILPNLSSRSVQTLVNALKRERKIYLEGKTKNARWFPTV
jgi:ATP-dependent DNA helicase RecG